jgi:putative transposase
VRIVRSVEQSGKGVPEARREQGIAENTYYRWRRKYGGASVPEVRRLRELEKENARLKRLVAERALQIDALQELLKGNW